MVMKKYVQYLVVLSLTITVYSAVEEAYPPRECVAYAIAQLPEKPILHAFFIPSKKKDEAKKVLLGLIHSEKTSIKASLYRLTDRDIALALKAAHQRGVKVQLLVDAGGFRDRNSQVQVLVDSRIPILTYQKHYSILHNKCFIFGNTLNGKRIIWTGSANITYGGLSRNIENVIVIENDKIFNAYMQDFNELQKKLAKKLMEKLAQSEVV